MMRIIKRRMETLALALVLGALLCACGALAEEQEIELIPMAFGEIDMLVPAVFNAVEESEGTYISAGPASAITVTSALEMDVLPSEWDESVAAGILEPLYGGVYTEIELAAFLGEANFNGNIGVYMAFYGINAEGIDRRIQVVRLYNDDLTAQYIVTFVHSVEDAFFTPEIADAIINSITLSQ